MDGDVVCRYDELELMQHLEDEDFEFMKITNKEHRIWGAEQSHRAARDQA